MDSLPEVMIACNFLIVPSVFGKPVIFTLKLLTAFAFGLFFQTSRRNSLHPPPKTSLTWDEYLLYDSDR